MTHRIAPIKIGRRNATPVAQKNDPMARHSLRTNIQLTQEAMDRHWKTLPPQARDFILSCTQKDGMFPFSTLVDFWSSPENIEFTRGDIAGSICAAVWYLASVYLRLKMYKEARALTVNGAFVYECYHSGVEYVSDLCKPGAIIPNSQLRFFTSGLQAVRTPATMESYIRNYLPSEYMQMMTSYANLSSSKDYMRDYVGQISDDWNCNSNASKSQLSSRNNHGTTIKLVIVDNTNGDQQQHSFNVDSTTTLKALFNDYAEKREVSLRSLRFSFMGKTLFLSSAGSKTPEEFGMQDEDVITVQRLDQESKVESICSKQTSTSTKNKAKKRSKKKTKGKSKKLQQRKEPTKSLEEYKIEHSIRLTAIHDEAQVKHFKQIRQRINNLTIERSQRKIKSICPRSSKNEHSLPCTSSCLLKEGVGGKAGKSHFEINVGEVENLYKTTKPSAIASHCSSSNTMPTLDLHGCTKEEALKKLNESLKVWVDTAMQGTYPFVQPARIVCGCGNQILSEVVENWIRERQNVSNAPKKR